MSQYALSKLSGVPQATLSDLCCNKTELEKCSAETLLKISKAVNLSMEDLLCNVDDDKYNIDDFEIFKSNVCHFVSKNKIEDVIKNIEESNDIIAFYVSKDYTKSFYLLAMLDYLSAISKKEINKKYDFIRMHKLTNIVYPKDILIMDAVMNTDQYKKKSKQNSIKEFMKYNIVENDIYAAV